MHMYFVAGQDDPKRIVQTFINLVQRHEQAFYTFVHKVHSKGEGLFDSLMKWSELYITFIREGLGEEISLEFLLPHTGKERANVLKEVDEVAMYHYKLKLAHEDKLRRRFGRAQNGAKGADAEDEAVKKLMDGVMRDLSVGELVRGEAEDAAAAEDEDDSEEYSSSEYETASGSDDGSDDSGSEETSSVETNEGGSNRPRPAVATRSSTISQPPTSPNGPHRFPSRSNHQRERDQQRHTPRGRSATSDNAHTLRPRSRTRSLQAIKNMLKKSASQTAPPVPPVPPLVKQSSNVSPYDKPLPPSPMVNSRTSVDSNHSQKQPRPALPQLHPRKAKEKVGGLTPPELHHIPNLLPVFVEIMRPLLRPASID